MVLFFLIRTETLPYSLYNTYSIYKDDLPTGPLLALAANILVC